VPVPVARQARKICFLDSSLYGVKKVAINNDPIAIDDINETNNKSIS
jgi:hypothetical protein